MLQTTGISIYSLLHQSSRTHQWSCFVSWKATEQTCTCKQNICKQNRRLKLKGNMVLMRVTSPASVTCRMVCKMSSSVTENLTQAQSTCRLGRAIHGMQYFCISEQVSSIMLGWQPMVQHTATAPQSRLKSKNQATVMQFQYIMHALTSCQHDGVQMPCHAMAHRVHAAND